MYKYIISASRYNQVKKAPNGAKHSSPTYVSLRGRSILFLFLIKVYKDKILYGIIFYKRINDKRKKRKERVI